MLCKNSKSKNDELNSNDQLVLETTRVLPVAVCWKFANFAFVHRNQEEVKPRPRRTSQPMSAPLPQRSDPGIQTPVRRLIESSQRPCANGARGGLCCVVYIRPLPAGLRTPQVHAISSSPDLQISVFLFLVGDSSEPPLEPPRLPFLLLLR